MIIYTYRHKPEPKWVLPALGGCPACHHDNNWVGFQVKHYSGAFWITVIPTGSDWLIMCDVCSTFFRVAKRLFKEAEQAYLRGIPCGYEMPEVHDRKGNLKYELRPRWWSEQWVRRLAELKKNPASPDAYSQHDEPG